MFNTVKRFMLFFGTLILFFPLSIVCYEVTLKGGSEIKEGAEILKQATEIASQFATMQSTKILLLIILGFVIALQGINILIKGVSTLITEQNAHKKGLLLGLMGLVFFGCGITIILAEESLRRCFPQKSSPITIHSTHTQPPDIATTQECQPTDDNTEPI